jgi:adenylate cyclase
MYADIIADLYQREAGLVVFNVLMPEADRFKQDGQLAQVLKQFPVVLPELGHSKDKNIPRNPGVSVVGADPAGMVVEYPGIISSVELINNNAAGAGVVNTFPEVDGVVRRMPLVILSNDKLHPGLALETLRVAAVTWVSKQYVFQNLVRYPQTIWVVCGLIGRHSPKNTDLLTCQNRSMVVLL